MQSNQLNIAALSLVELFREFWEAPATAFFNQTTVALVRKVSEKTLERDRWQGKGIPFRKIGGRVLYQKSDVLAYLESYALVKSTSEYNQEGICIK